MQKSKRFFILSIFLFLFMISLSTFPAKLYAEIADTQPTVTAIESGPVPFSLGKTQSLPFWINEPEVGGTELLLDDGSCENAIRWTENYNDGIWLNRFTPNQGEFPLSVNEVHIYFSPWIYIGYPITIVIYENTSGNTNPAIGSNWLYSYSTTVQAYGWNSYVLPQPVVMNGPGDVLIGFIGHQPDWALGGYWPGHFDQNASQGRSWMGLWSSYDAPTPPALPPNARWSSLDNMGYPGNFMIRAYYTPGAAEDNLDFLAIIALLGGQKLMGNDDDEDSSGKTVTTSSSNGNCFIATAAFGSPLAGQVAILRQFRDKYLLTNALGQNFVAWYYNNGPIAANWIKDKPLAKVAVQAALYPLIGFSFLLISGYLPFAMFGLLLSIFVYLRFRPKELREI